ncbi:MAG TPA: aminotransferase class III-fold pyridoxal phosphate-dependent enzyme [Micromonosporaceae bacterium]
MSHDVLGIDAVLQAPPPRFTTREACAIAGTAAGIAAADARNLGSERDQTFLLIDSSDAPTAVMKVSNPAEDVATLDMEALVAKHAAAADPGLVIAQPRVLVADEPRPAAYRSRWGAHWIRAYDVLPGRSRLDPVTLSDPALIAWGATTARLGLALRSFIHPNAIRRLPWDVQYAASVRPMLDAVTDKTLRTTTEAVLDRYDDVVAPRWSALRAQVIHSDLTTDNVLLDDDGMITGIIDFGDLTHSALVVDIASVLDSLAMGRPGDEMFRVARLVLDGYERVLPLEPIERELIGELWAARAAVGVAIGSWRASRGLEEPDFAQRLNETALVMMDHMLTTGWERTARELGAANDSVSDKEALVVRRDTAFGPALEPLSYADPIEMASASGVFMTDTEGRRFLDAYNNVVSLGHAHPRVTSAAARQWRVLNTNMRYLHRSAIELAERLTATCPPGLDTVLFVNSGSEANDVAWRLARHHTGARGGLCTDFAYHGITDATAALSPEVLPPGGLAEHVATWLPTRPAEDFARALAALAARGIAPAAAILDGVLQSDGVYDLDPAYVRELVRMTHDAGGLWIADEVQGGHGRTGDAMWSFQRFGIVPDFVTLGKPMGNGQPVGAVITRRELVERFAGDTVFFSTFGGNQVSTVAAHAVLDVIADERILDRVRLTGEELRAAIRSTVGTDDRVVEVRGMGLAIGIEMATAADAGAVKEGLRRRGVLVGTTARAGNVVKVRPPLAFTAEHVPLFVSALASTLES